MVYTREEYLTSMHHPQHTQCRLVEVAPHRRGLVAQEHIPQDELVMECKVGEGGTHIPQDELVIECKVKGTQIQSWKSRAKCLRWPDYLDKIWLRNWL